TSVDTELFREDFQVPTHLKTEDFDWERSRPSKPWLVRTGHHRLPGYWNLEWIKLSRADVTDRLCPVKEQDDSTQHASSESPATSTSRQTLESQEMPVGSGPRSTAGPRKGAAGPARHRGPRPQKFEQARDAMRNE